MLVGGGAAGKIQESRRVESVALPSVGIRYIDRDAGMSCLGKGNAPREDVVGSRRTSRTRLFQRYQGKAEKKIVPLPLI